MRSFTKGARQAGRAPRTLFSLGLLVAPLACGSATPRSNSGEKPPVAETEPAKSGVADTSNDAEQGAEQEADPESEAGEPPEVLAAPAVDPDELPEGVTMDGDCQAPPKDQAPGGTGPSIARYADLDLDVLEALLPVDPRDPDLSHSETSQWKRGWAGHGSGLVTRYIRPEGESSAIVTFTDLVHQCTCAPGMGARIEASRLKLAGSSRATVGGREGIRYDEPGNSERVDLEFWVADRCNVLVRGSGKNAEKDAEAITSGIDWEKLEAACEAREPKPERIKPVKPG